MVILLAGASGFLGTALRRHLTAQGHQVRRLVRTAPQGADQVRWDPERGDLPAAAFQDVDAVVNLAGAPIGHWPWTSSYRRVLLESRLQTSHTLAAAISELADKPAWVNASAVGYYGSDRGEEELSEGSAPGAGFLAGVVKQWEAATDPASRSGARVAMVRTAIVLDGSGGALKGMSVPFRLGIGGRLGNGRQWFPTVSLPDYLAAVTRLATDASMAGPYNVAAPVPATNADLTEALGRRFHRPTFMPAPGFAVRTVLGRDLSGQLLGSLRVRPDRLLAAGFEFAQPDLLSQLSTALP